jgi:hypothetical protein
MYREFQQVSFALDLGKPSLGSGSDRNFGEGNCRPMTQISAQDHSAIHRNGARNFPVSASLVFPPASNAHVACRSDFTRPSDGRSTEALGEGYR